MCSHTSSCLGGVRLSLAYHFVASHLPTSVTDSTRLTFMDRPSAATECAHSNKVRGARWPIQNPYSFLLKIFHGPVGLVDGGIILLVDIVCAVMDVGKRKQVLRHSIHVVVRILLPLQNSQLCFSLYRETTPHHRAAAAISGSEYIGAQACANRARRTC